MPKTVEGCPHRDCETRQHGRREHGSETQQRKRVADISLEFLEAVATATSRQIAGAHCTAGGVMRYVSGCSDPLFTLCLTTGADPNETTQTRSVDEREPQHQRLRCAPQLGGQLEAGRTNAAYAPAPAFLRRAVAATALYSSLR